jgi:hypothetical protein
MRGARPDATLWPEHDENSFDEASARILAGFWWLGQGRDAALGGRQRGREAERPSRRFCRLMRSAGGKARDGKRRSKSGCSVSVSDDATQAPKRPLNTRLAAWW